MHTPQPVMWEAILKAVPRGIWVDIQDIYKVVEHAVQLARDDMDPVSEEDDSPRWQRNVRNILQYRKTTRELLWNEDAKYMLPGSKQELDRRMQIWESIRIDPSPINLRAQGAYGGQQGIWIDKKRTSILTPDGVGIAVGLLHTGEFYPDDLSDDALLYHYPVTNRRGKDQAEIEATKNAERYGLPVFVIIGRPIDKGRSLRLGWVESWDDESKLFLVRFSESQPPRSSVEDMDETPFSLTGPRNTQLVMAESRRGQPAFRMKVIQRYGPKCAVCDVDILAMLESAHLREKNEDGSDDPRNGLVLCANHHSAMDANLLAFEPTTLAIINRTDGPSREEMGVVRSDIRHLPRPPHLDSIAWLWHRFSQTQK
jgi:putative restriction endonuclease